MTEDIIVVKFKVFDFDIEYNYRPSTDIYQEIVPKEIIISAIVPNLFKVLSFEEQHAILKRTVIEALSDLIQFDTPDAPDFEISDVTFCFEEAD